MLPVTLPVNAPINVVDVVTPETLSCLANNVVPVTVVMPANVESPETFNCLVNNVSPVTVVIPVNVETPETFNRSILTPPVKLDIPITSNKLFGCVLPIPTRLLTKSNTKLDAPSINPEVL